MNSEKRHFERIGTERPAQIKTEEQTHSAKMVDLSIQGTRLLSPVNHAINQLIELTFNLPTLGPQPIVLSATVTHMTQIRHQYLIGLKFEPSNLLAENAIKEYIHYHQRQTRSHI